MTKTIDYYLSLVSPWSYFGHERFGALAARHGARVDMMPIDIGKVFSVSGGLPLAKRPPQRLAYRIVELERWRDLLAMPLNTKPKFAASGADVASRWVLAAQERDARAAFDLAGAVMRARWAEDRDVADASTLAAIARALSLDADALAERACAPEVGARYETLTQKAIDAQVFGVPWYVYRGEPFWGQDRLDFLDRALAK
jgi:2-hydroxychromene-2-carboxylate isomerase